LNYLCGTQPDIFYAAHQCSRFCNDPKLSNEKTAKCIVRYVKSTPLEGLVLCPDSTHGIKCFADADFTNGRSSEDCEELSNVYSRTGFVIMYAGCPLIWVFKLQTEVALWATESECIALSQAMRELIALLGLLEELTPALQLNKDQPAVYWKACGYNGNNGALSDDLFEDNSGAYKLGKAPKMLGFKPLPMNNHLHYYQILIFTFLYSPTKQYLRNGCIALVMIGVM
jgi:hypothetical protein